MNDIDNDTTVDPVLPCVLGVFLFLKFWTNKYAFSLFSLRLLFTVVGEKVEHVSIGKRERERLESSVNSYLVGSPALS